MRALSRYCLSLFFLLAFIFPSVVKEIHAGHHEETVACDAGAQHHFHEHHEECHFCDAVIPITPEPSRAVMNFGIHHFGEYIFPHIVEVSSSSLHFSSTPLRAPPALS